MFVFNSGGLLLIISHSLVTLFKRGVCVCVYSQYIYTTYKCLYIHIHLFYPIIPIMPYLDVCLHPLFPVSSDSLMWLFSFLCFTISDYTLVFLRTSPVCGKPRTLNFAFAYTMHLRPPPNRIMLRLHYPLWFSSSCLGNGNSSSKST